MSGGDEELWIEKTGKNNFEGKKIKEIEEEYILILNTWKTEYEEYTKNKKKTKSLEEEENLFKRLIEYKEEHLLFIRDFKVPFSNNLAEKALRMIKTKLKVLGCFRGKGKGSYFVTIRSLFEMSKKHGMNLNDTVRKDFEEGQIGVTSMKCFHKICPYVCLRRPLLIFLLWIVTDNF